MEGLVIIVVIIAALLIVFIPLFKNQFAHMGSARRQFRGKRFAQLRREARGEADPSDEAERPRRRIKLR